MAERTRIQAIHAYVSQLQRIVSCVSQDIVRAQGSYGNPNTPVALSLAGGRPVRLRGPQRIRLRVRLRLQLVQAEELRGHWQAEAAAYEYRLSDHDDREILAYHWHPDGQSETRTPHLHLGAAAEIGHAALLTAHLPTGHVASPDVLRLAIESFDAEPLRHDWPRVFEAAQAP